MTAVIKNKKEVRNMDLSKNLRKLRLERGLSQAELAKKANVSQSIIAYIERGTKSPTVNLAYELAEALEVPIGELIK